MEVKTESSIYLSSRKIYQSQKRSFVKELKLVLSGKCLKKIKHSYGVHIHWNVQKLKNLTGLSFSVYQIYKTKFHSKLLSVIRYLRGLQILKIYSTQKYLFRNNSFFANKSLTLLSSSLKYLKELRCLEIYVANGCIIKDQSFIKYINSIKHARKLDTLKINCNMMTQITDESILSLNKAIPPSIKTLELKIKTGTYWNMGNVKGKSLNSIGKVLKTKHELLSLSLAFFQFNDVSIIALADAIKHLEKLILLEIDFSNSNIHDFGFFRLIRSLQSLRNLTTLSLDFYRCSQLRISTVLELERILLMLKRLEKLNLKFSEIDYSRPAALIPSIQAENFVSCKQENKSLTVRDYFEKVVSQLDNLKEFDVQIS